MNLSLINRILAIALANELEAMYCLFLQDEKMRNYILERLCKICTESFANEIIRTYNTKLCNGEYARVCEFPVDLKYIDKLGDELILLPQHVRIEWSGGQADDFDTTHCYSFSDDDKIAKEEGSDGRQIRRLTGE